MTHNEWTSAFGPKAWGAWNVVTACTSLAPGSWFMFLSSSAGVIGSRGQANYAAANCVLDAMAYALQTRDIPAVSLDLGPVLGPGMLEAEGEVLNMLKGSGFFGIRHEDFLKVVGYAIMRLESGIRVPGQIVMGVGTGGLVRQNQPADPYWTRTKLFADLAQIDVPEGDDSEQAQGRDLRSVLAAAGNDKQVIDMIGDSLVRMLAKSLNMSPDDMDRDKAPKDYGIDSLVAAGVRN